MANGEMRGNGKRGNEREYSSISVDTRVKRYGYSRGNGVDT